MNLLALLIGYAVLACFLAGLFVHVATPKDPGAMSGVIGLGVVVWLLVFVALCWWGL